jgi:hypothetical protein
MQYPDNMVALIDAAISAIVDGKRQVVIEYTEPGTGHKTKLEYSNTDIKTLQDLRQSVVSQMMPEPMFQVVNYEVEL